MKLVSALVGLAALGGVAFSALPASAMPVTIPGQAPQASNVEQTNYVCNAWGHCWHRPSYSDGYTHAHYWGGGYYHPHYWGGYYHPHYWGGGWGWHGGWGGWHHAGWGGGWHHGWGYWHPWHHWYQW
jgi:hypothetical protein